MEMSIGLTQLLNETYGVGVDYNTLLVTYSVTKQSVTVWFPDGYSIEKIKERMGKFIHSFEARAEEDLGALYYTVNGTYGVNERVATLEVFTITATPGNIRSLHVWLVERSDDTAAEELTRKFPAVFSPQPPEPTTPAATEPTERRRFWRR